MSTSPAAIPEVNGVKIKFVNPKTYKFKNERLVLVDSKCTPFGIYSVIPYTRNFRSLR